MSDVLRLVNVGLAMIVVVLLIAGSIHRWQVMPKRIRRVVPWIVATYVVIAYGSGEAASENTPAGVRVAMLACVLCGLVVALSYRIDNDDYSE
jgi:hypothetical protein